MFDHKKEAGVVISTYSMLSYARKDDKGNPITENAEKRSNII